MSMVSRIAFANMKYHRSKNCLTGVAVFLTTVLLFVIPTVGKNLIDLQYAIVNEFYPQWHALYRDVSQEMVNALSVHNDIGVFGLRSDVGVLVTENEQGKEADAAMLYLDENGAMLYKQELSAGKYPQKENELAVTRSALELMGLEGEIGDTISVPYQIWREGSLDYAQKKEFVITGLLEDEIGGEGVMEANAVYVSKEFMESELAEEEIRYRFLFQAAGKENATTDDVEYLIQNIAEQFGIDKNQIRINTPYLGANYVDPAILQITIVIMIIVVFAGMITIYSIYYVSMPQRVQEFGRLKALGASKRQIRQIVLQEGMLAALCAVPLGLIVGTIMTRFVLLLLCEEVSGVQGGFIPFQQEIIREQKIDLYYGWIYAMVVIIAFITVYASLLKPMYIAGRVSIIEAVRYGGEAGIGAEKRKNCRNISIAKLAGNNIFRNKKRSAVTIVSLSATGVFIMVVASVLACTSPEIITEEDFNGQYMIEPTIENNNREHPELAWDELQKDNPLNQELKSKLEQLAGVTRVDVFSMVNISGEVFSEDGFGEDICGLPEEYAKELEAGIVEGSAVYEDLKSGEGVIVDKKLLYWNPELKVGDKLRVIVQDGESSYAKELKIAAIGDYRGSILNYNYIIMAKEAADCLVSHNNNRYFCVMAEEDFNEALYKELEELCNAEGRLNLAARKTVLELNEASMIMLNGGCCIFFGILSAICIMNLVNTMINSVQVRKRELGMLQAIGMSDAQLQKMLLIEGMFYTIGTLLVTIGIGSILGYMAFLWAKKEEILRIRTFSYPWETALLVMIVLTAVQIFLSIVIGRFVRKNSMLDRMMGGVIL